MLARRLVFTWLTGIFFLIALFHAGLLPGATHTLFPESSSVGLEGGTPDGALHVVSVTAVPSVPIQNRVMNTQRSARAIIAPPGAPRAVYVERLSPYARYLVTGSIITSYPLLSVWWNTDGTLAIARQISPFEQDVVMVALDTFTYTKSGSSIPATPLLPLVP